jgi:Protein of unknown function (DUF4242)
MKALIAIIPVLMLSSSFASDLPVQPAKPAEHRYMIERTFPAGALAGLDADGKAKINATNAKYGVHWKMSYVNADKTKTFCVYEAPNEKAVRDAAAANNIPVDTVTEVPGTLLPK